MNIEIIELSEEEIQVVAGAAKIDPSATATLTGEEYPIIDNNPPG